MSRELDRSRPHIMRKHESLGRYICMYKDDPGTYFDMKGNPVDSVDAQAVGFNVEEDEKQATRNRLTAEALKEVDAKMAQINAEVDAKVEAEHAPKVEPKPEPVPAKEVYQQKSEPVDPPKVLARNAKEHPRETNRRKMEGGHAGRWSVIDKATGEKLHDDETLDTRTAEKLLMEQAI